MPNRKQSAKYYGIYRARCLNNQDPMGLSRVLVHIYMRDGRVNYDEDTHQWAPVLSPYGGLKGMGLYMIPPIHAEGFVIFEGGAKQKPIWIGTYPYAPTKTIDEEATKAAGYGVVKSVPTIPPELQNDPTKFVLKTQYPTISDPSVESNDNKIENLIVMDETKLELVHINQGSYEYSAGGVSSANASSYIRLTDNMVTIGVKSEEGKTYEIQVDSAGIRLISDLGDTVSISDGEIAIIGSDACDISLTAKDNGAVNINGKQIIIDGEQIIIGPPGSLGGGGAVTSASICPFVGLPIHQSSSKTIIGG